MRSELAIALAQVNPTVGDLAGNLELARRVRREAAEAGADLVVFPELLLIGYPPEDLVLRPALVDAAHRAIDRLVADSREPGPALLVTGPWSQLGLVYNAALLVHEGVAVVRVKHDLPNYGVFDEKRVFASGPPPEPIMFRGVSLGVMICEDMWTPEVSGHLAAGGAELLLVPNGSPYEADKFDARVDLARTRARETRLPVAYVNQVGGQDELVFDGASFCVNSDGQIAVQLSAWREQVVVTRWRKANGRWTCAEGPREALPDRLESTYSAMVIGLRDYVDKNRFPGVVLGLSGGIDSALSAAVAVDALGPSRVIGVRLRSSFTSELSMDEAERCARLLGIRLETLSIEESVTAVERALGPLFAGRPRDVTEENIQARIRGLTLMAISNKFGHMVLTTGNKSEMSVGYATLYGDMCGGYSVLKDVYKTEVYRLSRWRNAHRPSMALGPDGAAVPEGTISRVPTAELRANQTDQDSLPPYEQLDAALEGLVEHERAVDDIEADGLPRALVRRVQHMLYQAEYKRRQAPPGVKITRRSFGRDRRYPITNRFRDP
jgi:NAD+ synthase